MSHHGDETIDRAIAAYLRYAERDGIGSPQQPGIADTYREGDTIVLGNCHGELARYRVTEGGRLRRVAIKAGA